MGTALRRIDIIDKREHTLVVGIVVLQCNLDVNIVFRALKVHYLVIKRNLAAV